MRKIAIMHRRSGKGTVQGLKFTTDLPGRSLHCPGGTCFSRKGAPAFSGCSVAPNEMGGRQTGRRRSGSPMVPPLPDDARMAAGSLLSTQDRGLSGGCSADDLGLWISSSPMPVTVAGRRIEN